MILTFGFRIPECLFRVGRNSRINGSSSAKNGLIGFHISFWCRSWIHEGNPVLNQCICPCLCTCACTWICVCICICICICKCKCIRSYSHTTECHFFNIGYIYIALFDNSITDKNYNDYPSNKHHNNDKSKKHSSNDNDRDDNDSENPNDNECDDMMTIMIMAMTMIMIVVIMITTIATVTMIYTIWLFNIAMENPL